MKKLRILAASVAVLLSACGGSGGGSSTSTNNSTNSSITSVKVVGASLADSGTFGYKFTVQPSASYQVYSERIASAFHVSSICPAYSYAGTFTANAGCKNYAVAGAAVNNYDSGTGTVLETIPTSIIKQLVDVGNAGFSASDLLVVGEASSNDAAALATAYLTSTGAFSSLLGSLLDSTTLSAYAGDDITLGTLYMQALADKLMAAVEANALAKGATRVAVVNTLDITRTPRFQKALADVATALGSAAADQVQALVVIWTQAYNMRLAADVAASTNASKIAVVDLYTNFNARLNSPGTYGLTDTTNTVCDEVVTGGTAPGVTSLSTPSVVVACTATAAAAANLNGTTNGWQTFLFSDNFHPTPYGHQLLSDIVVGRLTAAGWM